MRIERFVINDRSWSLIEPLVPGTERDSGVTAKDTGLFLEAVFKRIFASIADDPDFEYVMIDGTIISVHQKASGAKGGLCVKPLGVQKAD
jgi:transposase